MTAPPGLSVLCIYLRSGGVAGGRGFWGRLFGRPLSYALAERALEAGLTCATVIPGRAGFAPGAKRVVADVSDVPLTTLPSCVELVGPVELIEAFVLANRASLADAVMLRLDGARMV